VQFNLDVSPTEDGWKVTVKDLQTGQPVVRPQTDEPFVRTLRRLGQDLNVFPLPPLIEAAAIPDDEQNPHRELCTTDDPKVLRAVFRNIIARKPDDVVKFGRYLFATLLGDELWDLLNTKAEAEPIELALSWQKGDVFINRLPWEMMCGPRRFLAQEVQVAITRRIVSATKEVSEIAAPRVLFVVGSDLGTDEIRPGAEYLGLLRSLRNQLGLRLKTHLLLRASPKRLKAAIKGFSPTVIHFICHGQADAKGEVSLKLMKDDNTGPQPVSANDLFGLLRPEPELPLPQIVVLNACYTASENPEYFLKAGQAASPIAVRLVEGDEHGGVPIVVGMAGQISDQACRLFTRCFYLSLLDGSEIAQATAAGRRLGIIEDGLTDPRKSVDWAMPTLFLSEGVRKARLQVEPPPVELNWHRIAAEFAPPEYPAFCDRLELFDLYDQLMSNYDALVGDAKALPQRAASQMTAIAVYVSKKENAAEDKHGRTWLLHEFAAQAVLNGHLPVLVNNEWIRRNEQGPPQTFTRLIEDLVWAMSETANLFNIAFTADCINLLDEVRTGKEPDASKLPQNVQTIYKKTKDYGHPAMVSAAARIDLLRLLDAARLQRPADERSQRKLLLLIDDVHQMDAAADGLLTQLLSTDGLRSPVAETAGSPNALSDVRVVFTFDSTLGLGKEGTIMTWLGSKSWVESRPLKIFQPPLEARVAYQFFLSRWKDENEADLPLTIIQNIEPEFAERFFENLAKRVKGVPSQLTSGVTTEYIRGVLDHPFKLLQQANDEHLLELIEQQRRGA
jgi:predicted Rdx family selenoprotein